ncbi:MAG TPA: prenyltransferase/squalene oxidase repeat-containing protein, partial [Humisphaera sp.]
IDAPEALFQRAPEQRRPMIEKLGGTKASEDAVERGLAWLSRVQEPDGRWSYVAENAGTRKKGQKTAPREHDTALTGLSVLAFLAADHSPAKEGPYRAQVAAAVDWLVAQQSPDGDLRGARNLRGDSAANANMYDHGIATMAVAEAALMTGDQRYADAALRAAEFICRSQNPRTGGWRYAPGQTGDTSVFGWQVMALHNAELLGFQTPPEVRQRAVKFLASVTTGRARVLAGYTPGEAPTGAMTAEALFCRILLGQPIEPDAASEVSEFIAQEVGKNARGGGAADGGRPDLYFWYYASLSLSQMQANPRVRETWDRLNARSRDAMIAAQHTGGDLDGSWTDSRWGPKGGGRVFSTALATLTLEVYYRYLPLKPADQAAAAAAWQQQQAADAPKKPKLRGPVGPKLEAN